MRHFTINAANDLTLEILGFYPRGSVVGNLTFKDSFFIFLYLIIPLDIHSVEIESIFWIILF